MIFNVALFEPEIPPNTGNIIRLCANTGCQLHLIHPLGFNVDDKKLRRAGLDYQQWTSIKHHDDYVSFAEAMQSKRIFACSTKATQCYADCSFRADDVFLFGPETRGLPEAILKSSQVHELIRIPMVAESRSLNLANAAAVIVYEAWRQLSFTT